MARWLLAGGLFLALQYAVYAQQFVVVTVPSNVGFQVQDISATTSGNPDPIVITVVNPSGFSPSQKLRVLARADAATFTGPGGSSGIPAGAVSWTAASGGRGRGGGTPFNGTLSTTYTQVFESNANFTSSNVQVTWYIGPFSATGVRAGTHTLPVRWRFEAF